MELCQRSTFFSAVKPTHLFEVVLALFADAKVRRLLKPHNSLHFFFDFFPYFFFHTLLYIARAKRILEKTFDFVLMHERIVVTLQPIFKH